MKNKSFFTIVLLFLVIAFSTDISAFEKKAMVNGEMETKFNLTKEQMEQLYKIREKYFSDIQRLRHEIFQKRIELKNLYLDSKADEYTILNKQKELIALRQKLEEKRTEMMLEERKILTPEQLDKLDCFPLEKRYEKMSPGMGRFRRGFGANHF